MECENTWKIKTVVPLSFFHLTDQAFIRGLGKFMAKYGEEKKRFFACKIITEYNQSQQSWQ